MGRWAGVVVGVGLVAGCPEPVDSDTEPPVSVPLQEVTPLELDFGKVKMGQEAPARQVTIQNVGTAALDVYDIYVDKDDEAAGFSIGSVGGGQRIRPGSAGTFVVHLIPNRPGPVSAVAVIESNATPPGDGLLLPLAAEGVKAELQVEPAAVEFVGAAELGRVEVVLRNRGEARLAVTNATITGSPAFGVDLNEAFNGTLPYDLEMADAGSGRPSKTLYVTYDPALAEGGDTGTLVIESDEWIRPTVSVPLTIGE